MSKFLGRKVTLEWDDEPIANLRTKSVAINNEMVDVTDDDSSGWRELLGEPGQKEVNISIDGVFSSDALMQKALSSGVLEDLTLEYPDGGTLSGSFALASYSQENPYNEAGTFDGELQSSGEITYTEPA